MGDTKYCKHCGQLIDAECVVCPRCGKQVEDLRMNNPYPNGNIYINNSSTNANMNPNFNVNAGFNGYGMRPMVSYRSKMVTLLLCIFLGSLGVHCFYAGKIGSGILRIVLNILVVGWIVWLVDIITIATGNFKDGMGLPIVQ